MSEATLTNILVDRLVEGELRRLTQQTQKKIELRREIGDGSFRTDIFISLSRQGASNFDNRQINYIAIEVKIKDWKQGLYQAWKYNSFAEKSYLAIYSKFAKKIDIELFKKYNVGLIVFDEARIEVLNKPKTKKFKANTYEAELRSTIWNKLASVESIKPSF